MFTDKEIKHIKQAIEKYILNHPKEFLEAMKSYSIKEKHNNGTY